MICLRCGHERRLHLALGTLNGSACMGEAPRKSGIFKRVMMQCICLLSAGEVRL